MICGKDTNEKDPDIPVVDMDVEHLAQDLAGGVETSHTVRNAILAEA